MVALRNGLRGPVVLQVVAKEQKTARDHALILSQNLTVQLVLEIKSDQEHARSKIVVSFKFI